MCITHLLDPYRDWIGTGFSPHLCMHDYYLSYIYSKVAYAYMCMHSFVSAWMHMNMVVSRQYNQRIVCHIHIVDCIPASSK